MNRNIIERAVKSYLLSCEDAAEKEQCMEALTELACVRERDDSADVWDNDSVLLAASTWCDILNVLTYDILGKRLRLHGENMHPDYYFADCRKQFSLESVPNCYLTYGYETLCDLWHDNEENGSNAPDGSFKGQS